MTKEELQDIFDNNNDLRHEVYHDAMENTYFWISEYLHGINGAEYEIGNYGPNWMKVISVPEFLGWVEDCHKCFEIWYDLERNEQGKVQKLIDKAMLLYDRLNYGYYDKREGYYMDLDDVNAERVETRLDEILEIFTDEFIKRCNAEYNYWCDDEHLCDYWMDTLEHWEEYYTETDENNHTLYREYTKIDKLA